MATVTAVPPATTPAPSAGTDSIMRLPPYFPTSCKECTQVTQTFFTCFEQHAVMKDETDRVTAAQSLAHCQPELRAYMSCMESHMQKEKKPWWKLF